MAVLTLMISKYIVFKRNSNIRVYRFYGFVQLHVIFISQPQTPFKQPIHMHTLCLKKYKCNKSGANRQVVAVVCLFSVPTQEKEKKHRKVP